MNNFRSPHFLLVTAATSALCLMLLLPFDSGDGNARASSGLSKVRSTSSSAGTNSFSASTQAHYGDPVRLKIPAINVDSAIEHLGLTSTGAMDVPRYRYEVTWFKLGPRPGDPGNAVIAGYRAAKDGVAVFANLYKLRKGDVIYVEDSEGRTTTFIVRKSRNYDGKARLTDVFTSTTGAHLDLITCDDGVSDSGNGLNQRLAVFADIRT